MGSDTVTDAIPGYSASEIHGIREFREFREFLRGYSREIRGLFMKRFFLKLLLYKRITLFSVPGREELPYSLRNSLNSLNSLMGVES